MKLQRAEAIARSRVAAYKHAYAHVRELAEKACNRMGRAGFEPATLGLEVVATGFGASRTGSPRGMASQDASTVISGVGPSLLTFR